MSPALMSSHNEMKNFVLPPPPPPPPKKNNNTKQDTPFWCLPLGLAGGGGAGPFFFVRGDEHPSVTGDVGLVGGGEAGPADAAPAAEGWDASLRKPTSLMGRASTTVITGRFLERSNTRFWVFIDSFLSSFIICYSLSEYPA